MPVARKKHLLNRKIVGVEFNRFSDGRGGKTSCPCLVLDNGSVLRFLTQETDMGDYGVKILVFKRPKV